MVLHVILRLSKIKKQDTVPHISFAILSQEWLVVKSFGYACIHFLQGDEGKPGKIGFLGRQGRKVWETISLLQK